MDKTCQFCPSFLTVAKKCSKQTAVCTQRRETPTNDLFNRNHFRRSLQTLALNPGFLFRTLSCSFGETSIMRDKIWNRKPGFKAIRHINSQDTNMHNVVCLCFGTSNTRVPVKMIQNGDYEVFIEFKSFGELHTREREKTILMHTHVVLPMLIEEPGDEVATSSCETHIYTRQS